MCLNKLFCFCLGLFLSFYSFAQGIYEEEYSESEIDEVEAIYPFHKSIFTHGTRADYGVPLDKQDITFYNATKKFLSENKWLGAAAKAGLCALMLGYYNKEVDTDDSWGAEPEKYIAGDDGQLYQRERVYNREFNTYGYRLIPKGAPPSADAAPLWGESFWYVDRATHARMMKCD